jgi:hypothetical protein
MTAAARAWSREFGTGTRESRLFDLARHWAVAVVGGEQLRAVKWIERAAEEASRRLAYEEAARLFQLALTVGRGHIDLPARYRLTLGLARTRHLAGDGAGCVEARVAAAGLARETGCPELLAEAALVAEAVGPTPTEAPTRQLCREALAALPAEHVALRARVTARYAEACIYTAWTTEHTLEEYETASVASADALVLAEQSADSTALRAALRARRLVCSGPEGLDERERLADRMLALGRATADPRTQMWARLWRIDAAFERGDLPRVTGELEGLTRCVGEVRGPHARYELLRCQAVLAQAEGRYADAMRGADEAFIELGLTGEEFGFHERAGCCTRSAYTSDIRQPVRSRRAATPPPRSSIARCRPLELSSPLRTPTRWRRSIDSPKPARSTAHSALRTCGSPPRTPSCPRWPSASTSLSRSVPSTMSPRSVPAWPAIAATTW